MAQKNEVNAALLITIGAVSGFLLLVIVIGLHAWFVYEQQGEIDRKWQDAENLSLAELESGQRQRITEYRWVDQSQGVVTIPIDDAVRLVAERGGKLPASRPAAAGHQNAAEVQAAAK